LECEEEELELEARRRDFMGVECHLLLLSLALDREEAGRLQPSQAAASRGGECHGAMKKARIIATG
jgi:hypothetical protein